MISGVCVKEEGLGRGVVLFNNSLRLYTEKFREEHWSYLGEGFMVEYDIMGWVYYSKVDEDLELISDGTQER